MNEQKPGGYDRVLAWLATHSPAEVRDLSAALDITRDRALLVLRTAERNGDARREPHAPGQRYPVQWSAETGKARMSAESVARNLFQTWLMELDDDQLAALVANWENVMDDATLTRVDSWVIAGNVIADLRSRPPAGEAGLWRSTSSR